MGVEDRRPGSIIDWAFGATGIADLDAPTVAEVAALTRFECGLTSSSVSRDRTGNMIDISSLCDRSSRHIAGSIQSSKLTLEAWREFGGVAGDQYWDLFDDESAPPATQHMVGCLPGFTGNVVTAGDVVDIYVVQVLVRKPIDGDKDSAHRFMVELAPLDHRYDSVIVA